MEILITILLKVVSLSLSVSIRRKGTALLEQARSITSKWQHELQSIVTEDPKIYQSAIWASLLCKRTMHGQQISLNAEHLRFYIDASITLQYNLTGHMPSMPYNMRNALVHDILFAHENRNLLQHALISQPDIFSHAVDAKWQFPKDYVATSGGLVLVPGTWWVLLTLKSNVSDHAHFIHYNFVYGNLLIDGQEMGTLPLVYRKHPTFRQIFGDKNPIVFPSPLPGMEFALSQPFPCDNRVHLGFRNGDLIIRTVQHGALLEYMPRIAFGRPGEFLDLENLSSKTATIGSIYILVI